MTVTVESTITFPYKRSLGPVLGAFMNALEEVAHGKTSVCSHESRGAGCIGEEVEVPAGLHTQRVPIEGNPWRPRRREAPHRAIEPGVAQGEDAAVAGYFPVPPAVGRCRHADDRVIQDPCCRDPCGNNEANTADDSHEYGDAYPPHHFKSGRQVTKWVPGTLVLSSYSCPVVERLAIRSGATRQKWRAGKRCAIESGCTTSGSGMP